MRVLSKLGIASRTETLKLIHAGQLTIDGKLITKGKELVAASPKKIVISGKEVTAAVSKQLFIFYKPKDTLTSRVNEKGRKTIFDFLPDDLKNFHAVGRLDYKTTGLLLITNSTELSSFLTDPVNEIPRVYVANVRGEMTEEKIARAKTGFKDEGELLAVSDAEIIKASGKESLVKVVLKEGKNREVRRIFLALGHEVTKLKRISFGKYKLGELKIGGLEEVDFPKNFSFN